MAQVPRSSQSDVEKHRAAMLAAPDEPERRHELARVLYRSGVYVEALDLLRGIDAPAAPAAWSFTRGLVHFRLEQWGEAEAAFARALESDPGQADWAAWRARALQAGGDLEGAAEALERVVAINPERAVFAVMLAHAYLRQEKFDEARAVIAAAPPPAGGEDPMLQRLRSLGGLVALAEARRHVLEGARELRATHWRRAEKAFARALLLAPEQLAWRVLRARARLGRGELGDACAELVEVVAADPRPPWLALLGSVHQRAGNLPAAMDCIERAIASDPNGPAWRAKLAGLRNAAGDVEGAVKAWRSALELNPGHRAWRYGFARALLKSEQPEAARDELETLASTGELPPAWRFLLGSVEARLGEPARAIVAWRDAVESAGPNAPPAWRARLAGLLALRGEDEAAASALEAAVAHPAAPPTVRAQLAQLYWRAGRTVDALGQIELALETEANPPFKWTLMAEEIRGRIASGASSGSLATSRDYADAFYRSAASPRERPERSPYFGFWRLVAERIERSGARRLLDIGCGPGQFAEFITGACPGISYTGVDFSGVAIDLARDRVPSAKFIHLDLTSSNNINELEYELVVALEVLEHIDADLNVLQGLRSGTRFVGSVPNFDSFGHVRFFRDAEAVSARYGERIEGLEVTPYSLAPNSTLFLMSGVIA